MAHFPFGKEAHAVHAKFILKQSHHLPLGLASKPYAFEMFLKDLQSSRHCFSIGSIAQLDLDITSLFVFLRIELKAFR